jgi:hypothetical protein
MPSVKWVCVEMLPVTLRGTTGTYNSACDLDAQPFSDAPFWFGAHSRFQYCRRKEPTFMGPDLGV